MMLLLSVVLALLPLLGVVYVFVFGSLTTVDGLFLSLMLLAMSGIFALNAFLEFREKRSGGTSFGARSGIRSAARAGTISTAGGTTQRGRVENVQFFEAPVGQPNRSVVVLSNGASGSNTLILDGDVRNALPVGRRVQLVFRKESGSNVLVDVSYS
jgi:hypothetical protein